MPANIVEAFALSLMITLFVLGYIREGYLEGLRLSSYSAFIVSLLGLSLYMMLNYETIKQLIYDPTTNDISLDKLPSEIYAYVILIAVSALGAFAVELYVKRKKENKK
jgi:hypothetical protein